jgi:acyl-coenzyme A synthetase/AMP-(fatty) acid ligase
MSSVPSTVRFDNGQTVSNHYKAITNYFNEKCKLHADNIFARYYSKENGNPVFKTLTYAQVDHLATNLACEWAQYVEGSKVISYISDHSVNYLIVMMAVLKLRVTLMALSPRNSEAADVNLLEKTNSKVLIATTKYEAFANDAASKVSGVKTIIIPSLDIDRLLQEPLNPEYNNLIDTKYSDEDLPKAALIIHRYG